MKHGQFFHEDWLLISLGAISLAIATLAVTWEPNNESPSGKPKVVNHAKGWFPKLEAWDQDPTQAFYAKPKSGEPYFLGRAIFATWCMAGLLLLPIAVWKQIRINSFLFGYNLLFAIAVLAFLMASQSTIKFYNLEYVLWALVLGVMLSNTLGIPEVLKPMLLGDSIIKVALVIFGAEVLFGKLISLGIPGILTSWLVTPIVLVSTFWFGQRILKISSPSLNMVISADMSVCGVSAAIATGAACRAKKEEVSYAIGVSLFFTAIMMVVQPMVVLWTGMDKVVGAAWMGGTIDSTGAVAAAGATLGEEAATVANTVKMIQNVLIGVIAFAVAAYWSSRYGMDDSSQRVGLSEIWKRFPKFVLGFLGASMIFSFLPYFALHQGIVAETITKEITSPLRTWLFCLAFVAFGLEMDMRQLWQTLRGGKPLTLYLVGQAWSMVLSLTMAYLMFGVWYGDKIKEILSK